MKGGCMKGSGDQCRGAMLVLFDITGMEARILLWYLLDQNPGPGDEKNSSVI